MGDRQPALCHGAPISRASDSALSIAATGSGQEADLVIPPMSSDELFEHLARVVPDLVASGS